MIIISLLIGSYLLGSLLTGSLLSTVYYKEEIRTKGSGNPGARNMGRLYGKKAFVITFLGDALKGIIVVYAARIFGFDQLIELLLLLFVIIGHIYPMFYRFRGGKGVSTFIGGLLVFNPLVFLVFVSIFLVLLFFMKNFTGAGLSATLSLPIVILVFSYNTHFIYLSCLISGIILFAHRDDIKWKHQTAN